MKYRRAGFEEAKAEASRIAEAFVAAETPEGGPWIMEFASIEPSHEAPGFDRRKPITLWIAWFVPRPTGGCSIDGGDGWVLVDLGTKEARWCDLRGE